MAVWFATCPARTSLITSRDCPSTLTGMRFTSLHVTWLLPCAQAWNVEHTDPPTRHANLETLEGIADVLLDFPSLRCEV